MHGLCVFAFSSTVPAFNEGLNAARVAKRKEQLQGLAQRIRFGRTTDADKEGFLERYAQERRVLSALLTKLEMDPQILTRRLLPGDGNWLGELHKRLTDRVPSPLMKV